MSDLIALHWGPDEITAVAPAKGRDVRAVSLGARPEDAASLGRWLKSELAAQRFAAKRAVVVLPRSAAVFRKLTLPEVPADELPDLVRMQAATKAPTPLDRLRFDFVPLPRRGEGQEVLLATIPAKTAEDALAAVRAAGLEPAGIVLSAYGTAARVAADASTLIVAVQGSSVEITLVRDSAVVLSHSTELQGGSVEEDRLWLPGEVTRAVVAADHLAAANGIPRVLLIGPGELLAPLVPTFADRYRGRAELIDEPGKLGVTGAEGNVSVAALAAAAGSLDAAALPRLDFLNPRKRVERPDHRRRHAILAAAAVAAVALVAYGLSWRTQASLEEEIEGLTDRSGELQSVLDEGKPALVAHGAIKRWVTDRPDWVGQMAALDDALPGTDRAYLERLVFESNQRSGSNQQAPLGTVTADGRARSRREVETLNAELAAKGYLVAPRPIIPSSRDPQYSSTFKLDVTIPRPTPPAEPATPKAAPRST